MGKPPRLNIIYDSRRHEKYEPLMEEMARQKISYQIWDCIMLNDIPSSINASHKMIVRDAKERGLNEVCIGEDDLWFPAEDGWEYFLKNKPKEYDLYLSGTYILTNPLEQICGFHLYIISSKFYDKFLSMPDNQHIDTAANDLKGDYKFCYPFAALQRVGFSANNSSVVNYNSLLKEEDVYGKFK